MGMRSNTNQVGQGMGQTLSEEEKKQQAQQTQQEAPLPQTAQPRTSTPSAPSQPSMDRTPAPQNAPMGGKMDRTPIVAKAGAPKKDGGPKEASSVTEEKTRKQDKE